MLVVTSGSENRLWVSVPEMVRDSLVKATTSIQTPSLYFTAVFTEEQLSLTYRLIHT